MINNNPLSRRKFLKSSAVAGTIGMVGGIPLLNSCSSEKKNKKTELQLPELLDQHPMGKYLKQDL